MVTRKTTSITAASLIATIPVVMGGQSYLDSKYVQASQFAQFAIDTYYGQYYDRLDDYEEAVAEGRMELAKEYKRQMEKLKAKICEEDPEWERCGNPD